MLCIVISCHNLSLSGLRNLRACFLPWRWLPSSPQAISNLPRIIMNTTEGRKEVRCASVRVVLYCVVVLCVVLWCMLYVLSCEFCVSKPIMCGTVLYPEPLFGATSDSCHQCGSHRRSAPNPKALLTGSCCIVLATIARTDVALMSGYLEEGIGLREANWQRLCWVGKILHFHHRSLPRRRGLEPESTRKWPFPPHLPCKQGNAQDTLFVMWCAGDDCARRNLFSFHLQNVNNWDAPPLLGCKQRTINTRLPPVPRTSLTSTKTQDFPRTLPSVRQVGPCSLSCWWETGTSGVVVRRNHDSCHCSLWSCGYFCVVGLSSAISFCSGGNPRCKMFHAFGQTSTSKR